MAVKTKKTLSERYPIVYCLLRHPSLLRKALRQAVKERYEAINPKTCALLTKSLEELVDVRSEIKLQNFISRDGNVSSLELMALASIVANLKPYRLLEIGTFDGNTTLQLALNALKDAKVFTLDLPPEKIQTQHPILDDDIKYVYDAKKLNRKYATSSVSIKVEQHLGDSGSYDFKRFVASGQLDFCFIDGGHTYECVKNDTEKTMPLLGAKGVVVWHDFHPHCDGVYRYLNEKASELPLVHIAGTTLVYYGK